MLARFLTISAVIFGLHFSLKAQSYRPVFHFTPEKNWTNDPNGLVYYKGEYHIFFQHNPFGDVWGHMSWGHATSKDMMKWNYKPIALQEYQNGNGTTTMFFSGTAVVDKNNTSGFAKKQGEVPLIAIYTAHVDSSSHGISQSQHLAYSQDGIHFQRYNKNPLIDLHTTDFRDPKVFWSKRSRQWVMVASKPLDYMLQFYGSADLKNWKLLSEFTDSNADKSKIWECPDIFELPVKNEPGKSKWVVTLSGGHPQKNDFIAMQYFIGDFDGTTFTADKISYPLYVDEGKDFYAGIIINSLPETDKRKIMIGWANCWAYANKIPTKGFRGQMSVPRELNLYRNGTGELRMTSYPVTEVDNYMGRLLLNEASATVNGHKNLDHVKGDALDIEYIIDKGSADRAGVSILKNGKHETLIYYNKSDNTLKIDRTKSGNVSFSDKFASVESIALPEKDKEISLRILIDKCIIEVFANKGEQVMTDLVFPLSEDVSAELFSEGGETTFRNIKVHKMLPSMKN
jgi:fructan beta-fructosidase